MGKWILGTSAGRQEGQEYIRDYKKIIVTVFQNNVHHTYHSKIMMKLNILVWNQHATKVWLIGVSKNEILGNPHIKNIWEWFFTKKSKCKVTEEAAHWFSLM